MSSFSARTPSACSRPVRFPATHARDCFHLRPPCLGTVHTHTRALTHASTHTRAHSRARARTQVPPPASTPSGGTALYQPLRTARSSLLEGWEGHGPGTGFAQEKAGGRNGNAHQVGQQSPSAPGWPQGTRRPAGTPGAIPMTRWGSAPYARAYTGRHASRPGPGCGAAADPAWVRSPLRALWVDSCATAAARQLFKGVCVRNKRQCPTGRERGGFLAHPPSWERDAGCSLSVDLMASGGSGPTARTAKGTFRGRPRGPCLQEGRPRSWGRLAEMPGRQPKPRPAPSPPRALPRPRHRLSPTSPAPAVRGGRSLHSPPPSTWLLPTCVSSSETCLFTSIAHFSFRVFGFCCR